jgi:hypothetical protein
MARGGQFGLLARVELGAARDAGELLGGDAGQEVIARVAIDAVDEQPLVRHRVSGAAAARAPSPARRGAQKWYT